jgi:signal transduction histidine kinase
MRSVIHSFLRRTHNFFHSVRFRMSLWFVLVLAAVLLVFSSFVYYRTVQDVREQTAARMIGRLRELNTAFLKTYHYYDRWGWWIEPGISVSETFVLQDDEILVISDAKGKAAGAWGAISAQDRDKAASLVVPLRYDKFNARFFSFELNGLDEKGTQPVDYVLSPAPVMYENRLLGWIIIGQPVDPTGQLPRLRLTLAISATFTLLVALGGGYWLANRALWPVTAITRTAQVISETDLSRRLNLHTRDELGELAGTFDQMLDRLQAAFIRQRQFTADASHELRTPLTIIGLETNRALEGKRSAQEYRQALEVIQCENEFMARLVSELLTLARMDSGQVELKREPLDLSDLALDVIERYAQLAAQKGISLQAGDLPELPIQGDRQYLLQLIGNLVDNAIKYSPPGQDQWVRVETGTYASTAPPAAWLRVSDNGAGISADHLPHIFDRFYRADRVRSHNPDQDSSSDDIPGSGLGLSIVQWIAQVHGGTASVTSQPGRGSAFEVQFPMLQSSE